MLFTQKPNAILFAERGSLSLHLKTETASMPLSDEVFKYLEVRDAKKLSEQFADFAKKHAVRGKRLLIILHKDIVFQKAVNLSEDSDVQSIIAGYEHMVPFENEDRRAVGLHQQDRLFLFGTNKAFYQFLIAAAEEAGAKVQSVVPGLIYGLTEHSKLTQEKFEQVCNNTALTKAVNFLD